MDIGFSKNTLIWMADGSFKKVISLKKGDLVDTFEGPAYVELILAHRYFGIIYEFANAYMAPDHYIHVDCHNFEITSKFNRIVEEYDDYVYNIVVTNRSSVRIGYDTELDIYQNECMTECYAGTLGDKALFGSYYWGTEFIIDNIKKVDDQNIGYVVCEKPILVTDADGRVEDITF